MAELKAKTRNKLPAGNVRAAWREEVSDARQEPRGEREGESNATNRGR